MWFPLFINLENKKVLVIGGGKVALKKIKKVLEYGADVTVVTDNIKEQSILELKNLKIEGNKKIENNKDEIEKLVKDFFLVISATDDEQLNENIAQVCDSKEILINNASSKTKMNGKNCKRSRAMKSEIQKVLDKIEK